MKKHLHIFLLAMFPYIAFSQSTIVYDVLGRIDSITYPDSSWIKYRYDNTGNLLQKEMHSVCDRYSNPTITGNAYFCIGDSVLLTSSPASKYLWSTGDTTRSIWVKTVIALQPTIIQNGL